MKLLVRLLAVGMVSTMLLACSGPERVQTLSDGKADRYAQDGAFAFDRLFLMDEKGRLASIDLKLRRSRDIPTDHPLIELCAPSDGKRLYALASIAPKRVQLLEWNGSTWNEGPVFDVPVSGAPDYSASPRMACDPQPVILVTDHILILEGEMLTRVDLSRPIDPTFAVPTLLVREDILWAGFNAGEWGGGMRKIDLTTGKVEVIERVTSPDLCSGPLNTECDVVYAVAPSPWSEDCVVATAGSDHLSVRGRLLQICQDRVERFYFRRFDNDPLWEWVKNDPMTDGEPALTVGFYGLHSEEKQLWALGSDGIYRFSAADKVAFTPLPSPQNVAGFGMMQLSNGLVLVQRRQADRWPPEQGVVYDGSHFLMIGRR